MINTIAVGMLAFIGSLLGTYISRKSNKETDIWRKREETYRMLRYAIDLTEKNNNTSKLKGITIVDQLLTSELIQREDIRTINKLMDIIIKLEIKL